MYMCRLLIYVYVIVRQVLVESVLMLKLSQYDF